MAIFCPSSAEWGNVADWVSGVGSAAAAIVAVWLGWGEHRRYRAEKSEAAIRDAEIENTLRVQALLIWRDIRQNTEEYLHHLNNGGDMTLDEWQRYLATSVARALRLQQLPGVNVKAFSMLDEIAQWENMQEGFPFPSNVDSEDVLSSLIAEATRNSQRIFEERNPLAPLNW